MINKELIELQRKCKATCVLIQNDDCKNLDSKVIINANSSNYELLTTFKEEISQKQNLNYSFLLEFLFSYFHTHTLLFLLYEFVLFSIYLNII